MPRRSDCLPICRPSRPRMWPRPKCATTVLNWPFPSTLAALAFIFAVCAGSSAGAASGVATPRFEPGACPARVASSPAFAHAQCGQLIVPENHHKQNGKTISISVAIIPSITQPSKHEPLFYITGGPGGDAMGDSVSGIEPGPEFGGAGPAGNLGCNTESSLPRDRRIRRQGGEPRLVPSVAPGGGYHRI